MRHFFALDFETHLPQGEDRILRLVLGSQAHTT